MYCASTTHQQHQQLLHTCNCAAAAVGAGATPAHLQMTASLTMLHLHVGMCQEALPS
jgi:hypothetical protein